MEREKVLKLLRYATNYLKEQKQDPGIYGSCFPSLAKEDRGPQRSRLAWCYGDLGIAIALRVAAGILQDESLSNLALEVFLFSASRKGSEKEIVLDAGLCHGSGGLAQIFYRIYKDTHLPELLDAYNYWDNVTLEFAFKNGSFAEYKKYVAQEKSGKKRIIC